MELRNLKRESNLLDLIRSALQDIQSFKRCNLEVKRKQKKQQRNKAAQQNNNNHHNNYKKRDDQRLEALEHQRNRLLQQKQRQPSASTSNASSSLSLSSGDMNEPGEDVDHQQPQDEDKKDDEVDDDDDDDDDDDEAVVVSENAWIRLIRTINSLVLVTRVLGPMLFHPHAHNPDLQLLGSKRLSSSHTTGRGGGGGGGRFQKKRKKQQQQQQQQQQQCWILGTRVYDVGRVSAVQSVRHQWLDLLDRATFGVQESSSLPPPSLTAAAMTTTTTTTTAIVTEANLLNANSNLLQQQQQVHGGQAACLDRLLAQVCRAADMAAAAAAARPQASESATTWTASKQEEEVPQPQLLHHPWAWFCQQQQQQQQRTSHGSNNDSSNNHNKDVLTLADLDRRAVEWNLDQHFGLAVAPTLTATTNTTTTTFSIAQEEKQRYDDFQRCITELHRRVSYLLLRQKFAAHPAARLSVYGSCWSQLSLGPNSDVDMSLYLPAMHQLQTSFEAGKCTASRFDKERKSLVYQVCRKLELYHDFIHLQPVAHARVPVIKGTWTEGRNPYSSSRNNKNDKNHSDKNNNSNNNNNSNDNIPSGSIDFDICLNNDIAVVNSSLIREYCSMDARIPYLCRAVKQWAKACRISSAADRTLSSYTWTNMVLIYLQYLQFIPNLQSTALLQQVRDAAAKKANEADAAAKADDENDQAPSKTVIGRDPEHNPWHCINNLDTFYLKWVEDQVQNVWHRPVHLEHVSVTALLYGFFEFYGNPAQKRAETLATTTTTTNEDQNFSFCYKDLANSPLFVLGVRGAHWDTGPIPKTVFRKCSWFWSIEDPFETYDSHCPHDLGAHADEKGVLRIRHCLSQQYQHLHQRLFEPPREATATNATGATATVWWAASPDRATTAGEEDSPNIALAIPGGDSWLWTDISPAAEGKSKKGGGKPTKENANSSNNKKGNQRLDNNQRGDAKARNNDDRKPPPPQPQANSSQDASRTDAGQDPTGAKQNRNLPEQQHQRQPPQNARKSDGGRGEGRGRVESDGRGRGEGHGGRGRGEGHGGRGPGEGRGGGGRGEGRGGRGRGEGRGGRGRGESRGDSGRGRGRRGRVGRGRGDESRSESGRGGDGGGRGGRRGERGEGRRQSNDNEANAQGGN
ncbi:hypothetical protein ACA910_003982 [Epithemia clementina (nom. ined.)]